MSLDKKVIKDFVAAVNKKEETKTPTILTGTVHRQGGTILVQIDGSESLTPVSTVINVEDGERVTLTIENHKAMITGNLSSPAARGNEVEDLKEVVADKVSTAELSAITAKVGTIEGDVASFKETTTESLKANEASIKKLDGDAANFKETTTEKLTAQEASIKKIDGDVANFKETTTESLKANEASIKKLDGDVANFKKTTTDELSANSAAIGNLDSTFANFKDATADKFKANDADIENLKTGKISAKDADLKYANIDFSNIGKTAMEYFYAQSGLVKDVTIGDATITGELVGVTISGDLIQGNTIVAEKLVIKGSDGLYYKLNTDGMSVEKEQTDYNSINGQVIRAKSITATKIDVKDLVAFGATIGGFKISQNSIYSGVKETVGNTTRGIYMDNDGQFVFGDASQYVKFYRVSEGKYKLAIAVEDLYIGSANVADAISDAKDTADNAASVASSAKSTAEGASKTASAANSIASSAKTTADGANKTAAEAKNTASNASSVAGTAKTIADQAKSTADTATKNLTALTTRVTEAETTIKKSNEEIELRAKKTEVTEAINNIDIGGRNLFLNTGIEQSTAEYKLATYKPAKDPLMKGKIYTVTVCITPAQGVEYIRPYLSEGNSVQCQLPINGTDKQIISATFEADYYPGKEPDKDVAYASVHFYRFPNDGTVKTASIMHWIKIEEGNKPTDWSPAPEDYYTKTETDASIKVLSDKIASTVETTDDLGKRMSNVEQDSSSWSVTLETANAAKTAADQSIKSTTEQFYKSTSPTSLSGGSWSNSQPTWENGKYIWKRTYVVKNNGTTEYQPSSNGVCITGSTGSKGDKGDPGTAVTISSKSVTYQASSSGTTVPTGTWSTSVPTYSQGQYLWTKTYVKYSDGKDTTSYSVAYKGTDGKGIKSIVPQYYLSTSNTTQTGGSWSNTQPTWTSGKYIWTRDYTTWDDNTATTSTPVLASALNSANSTASAAKSTADTARTEAAAAAKVATNYMKFDSTGLTVGDHTANTLGRNVNIDSTSVNIRNGTDVLASFAESLIEIGKKTSVSAVNFMSGTVKLIAQTEMWNNVAFRNAYLLAENTISIGAGSTDPSSDSISSMITVRKDRIREINADVTDTDGHSYVNIKGDKAVVYSDGKAGYSSVNVVCNDSTSQVELYANGSNGDRKLYHYSHALQYYDGKTLLAKYDGKTPCLWDGGAWMFADQTITLHAPISEQPHGIVVIFALYDPTTSSLTNAMTNPFFVPKTAINYSYVFTMFWENAWQMCTKRVTIQDTCIIGNDANKATAFKANCGITSSPQYFVLRRIYGV